MRVCLRVCGGGAGWREGAHLHCEVSQQLLKLLALRHEIRLAIKLDEGTQTTQQARINSVDAPVKLLHACTVDTQVTICPV